MNFFEILGCTPDDDPETIRKAWRKLVIKHHPDKGGDKELFMRVMHAYRMVSDPSYRTQQTSRPTKDLTLRVKIAVEFVEAFYGTKVTINFNKIKLNAKLELIKEEDIETCHLEFSIPAGSNSGMVHTEKGKGASCGEEVGDVVVQVVPLSHDRYTVKGIDVFCDEKVPLDLMLTGGELVVDTLWGYRTIWIPPGTQPGKRIRVPECGVSQQGYQYSRVQPVFPDENVLKTNAWKGLNINWERAKDKNKEDADLIAKFEELKNKKDT